MFDFMRFRKEAESVGKQLKGLRSEIEEKKREREDLEHAPLSREDLADGLCSRIDVLAAPYPQYLRMAVEGVVNKPFHDFAASQQEIISTRGNFAKTGHTYPENLAWLFGDLIKERLRDAVHAMEWPDDQVGPPIGERRQLMAKLDKEIAELERKEAELIAEARKAGLDIGGLVQDPAVVNRGRERKEEDAQLDLEDQADRRTKDDVSPNLVDPYLGGRPVQFRHKEAAGEDPVAAQQREWARQREAENRRAMRQQPKPEEEES
ncbi:MAG TPA: hypothetical protein VKA64_02125 [Gammaproteobacteria bacterium]|nr:hypothetical protein [Gammaproteobacteria bacterium]